MQSFVVIVVVFKFKMVFCLVKSLLCFRIFISKRKVTAVPSSEKIVLRSDKLMN